MARIFGVYLLTAYVWQFRHQIFWEQFYWIVLLVFGMAVAMQFFLVPSAGSTGLMVR